MRPILMVDDERDLCMLAKALLESTGKCRVDCASTLSEVHAKEPELPDYDAAVLDITLGAGEPTGLEVRRWLLAHGFRGRIVFLTGHPRTDPLVAEAAALPDIQLLQKPQGFEQLRDLLLDGGARPPSPPATRRGRR